MKKSWKYVKDSLSVLCFLALLPGSIFLIPSCTSKHEQQPPSNSAKVDLGGLVKPVNNTIFSDVKVIAPEDRTINPVIKTLGVIGYDPRLINNISMRYGGRIEKLYIRFNFQEVSKGERLMDIYSPEILTEQQNLIFLLASKSVEPTMLSTSENKLKLLGLTGSQIKQIETSKQPINPIPVYSTYAGHIHDIGINSAGPGMSSSGMNTNMSSSSSSMNEDPVSGGTPLLIENLPSSQTSALTLKEGMYVQSGQSVFAIYDISKVWAVLDIYQKDAMLLRTGDKVMITSETSPTDSVSAIINYIEPVSGQNASTIKARVYLQNTGNLHLKVGTLLTAKIALRPVKGIWVPRSAVIDLGDKMVVFVQEKDHFKAKRIQAGAITDSFIQILGGLNIQQKIAASAQYLVDSESFIKTDDSE
jgi:Cu(I)/Ag(I) efflux system membrane fusion protein